MATKQEEQANLSDVLTPSMNLTELEMKFADETDGKAKDVVQARIKKAEDGILPLRLQFNDFTQIMSSLDEERYANVSKQEKFQMIRSKVLGLTERLQELSNDFEELQPLFATVGEYSKTYKNKNFQVLENLASYNHRGKAGASISNSTPTPAAATPTTAPTPGLARRRRRRQHPHQRRRRLSVRRATMLRHQPPQLRRQEHKRRNPASPGRRRNSNRLRLRLRLLLKHKPRPRLKLKIRTRTICRTKI
ncbi:Mediator complex subunit 3 fungal [Nakaseomyces glabratus]